MWTEEKGVTDSDFGGSGAGKQPSEQASHDPRARTHFYRLHRPPWYVEMTRTVLMSPMQTANLQARVPFRPCDSRLLFVFRHVHLCDLCMHANVRGCSQGRPWRRSSTCTAQSTTMTNKTPRSLLMLLLPALGSLVVLDARAWARKLSRVPTGRGWWAYANLCLSVGLARCARVCMHV